MNLLKISFVFASMCLYTQYATAQYYDLTDQEQALLTAAEQGNLNKVKELVNAGVNINIADDTGHTALHFAARTGRLPIVKFLIEKGANINAQSKFFETPLRQAQKFNKTEVINYLQSQGAR